MKDFKLNFIHLCDEAIFSQDGKLSLIGIFEVVNVMALPGSLLKAFLVFNLNAFNKNLNKIDLDIVIKKADTKKELVKLPTLSPGFVNKLRESKIGVTLGLANITFQEVGRYVIEIQANKELIGSLDFEVKLLEQKKEKN
ncbi:MAG: hypothetical protein HY429_02565 [Candidatus Levybacteria bacterium]|nr:hypothetical protein [Candidatus Levybacteria bacterium]